MNRIFTPRQRAFHKFTAGEEEASGMNTQIVCFRVFVGLLAFAILTITNPAAPLL